MVQAAAMYNTLLQCSEPAVVVECLNGYRLKEQVPENLTALQQPLGIPEILTEGDDCTLVSYGSTLRVIQAAMQDYLRQQRGMPNGAGAPVRPARFQNFPEELASLIEHSLPLMRQNQPEFRNPTTPPSDLWGWHPQPSHWWRHLDGGSGRGMHVGVDAGVGFNNLHFDASNPAVSRNNNPVVGAIQGVMGRSDQLNTETCRYDPRAIVSHQQDIRSGGQDHSYPAPYFQYDNLRYGARRIQGGVQRESNDPAATERSSLRSTLEELNRLQNELQGMDPQVRSLSAQPGMEDDPAGGNPLVIQELRQRVTAMGERLMQAIHSFAGYLSQSAYTLSGRGAIQSAQSASWNSFTTVMVDNLVAVRDRAAADRVLGVPEAPEVQRRWGNRPLD